jgi:hypothetical protein
MVRLKLFRSFGICILLRVVFDREVILKRLTLVIVFLLLDRLNEKLICLD